MQIRIDLSAADPPEGTASSVGTSGTRAFAGWLELVAAIEALVERMNERF